MSATRDDLGPILDTLREVNVSLERRARRASAANAVTWGLVASGIFAFYAWVHANRETPLVVALREAGVVEWVWVLPLALGYVATLFAGVRLGRMAPTSEEARGARWLLLALLVPVAGVVLALVTRTGQGLIPAMWVAFLGVVYAQWGCFRGHPLERVLGAGSFAVAAGIAFLPGFWANLLASAWYLVALAGMGAWRYHRA